MKKIPVLALILLTFVSCDTNEADDKPEKNKTAKKEEKKKDRKYTLEEKVGQMIMIGLGDIRAVNVEDSIIEEVRKGLTGGIILFEKNIPRQNSYDSLKGMISTLQEAAKIPLFISIDEEGGQVHRLKRKYGFVDMPSAAELGRIDEIDTTVKYTRRLAAVLDDLGINLNYAPVVDLAVNPSNPIIAQKERSYSPDPEVVTRHARASIEAHHDEGVKTIIKHFPGHGSSKADTHKGVADVSDTWNMIELYPYRNLIKEGKTDAIMTAHVVNCRLDTACLPATLSPMIVQTLLRDMLEYEGVVFSDDMQMFAISREYGTRNAIQMAINAGVDVLVFGNNVSEDDRMSAQQIHTMIMESVRSGAISEERINEAFERIMELKRKKIGSRRVGE